jgi:hypothetical protein
MVKGKVAGPTIRGDEDAWIRSAVTLIKGDGIGPEIADAVMVEIFGAMGATDRLRGGGGGTAGG